MRNISTILNQVVGYHSVCISDKGRAQSVRLGVHVDYQRFGIGKQLLAAGLEWLWAKGIREVMLQVHRENLPGRLLYERFGFTEESSEYLLVYSEGGV